MHVLVAMLMITHSRKFYFVPAQFGYFSEFAFLVHEKIQITNSHHSEWVSIVDTCLSCKDIARQSCAMERRWQFLA